jgi:hypothetical protein
MALSFSDRSSTYTTTGATSYATGTSFTPAANSLMICFVFASSTDTTESQPTSVSGNGVTYTQLTPTYFQSAVTSGSVWVGIVGSSPTSDVVTASGWGTARTGISMAVLEVTGADVSGTAANAVQTLNTAGPTNNTTLTVTMSGPVTAGNLCCGMFDHTANEVIAAGTGCTLGSTGNYASPNRGSGSVYDTTVYTSPVATWTTSAGCRGFGIEIKIAAAGGGTVLPRRDSPAVNMLLRR